MSGLQEEWSMNVCIYGASSTALDDVYYRESEKLGEQLAKNGYGLVFGAGNRGLMGSAARGAHAGDGYILGIVPSFFDMPGVIYQDCTELITTETMRERKQLMEEHSDAIVVLPGGIGTFEEFFEIYTLKQLGRVRHPIIIFNINRYYDPLLTMLEHAVREHFLDGEAMQLFVIRNSVEEVIETLKNSDQLSDTHYRKYENMQ